jgi:hypothetical protein
MIKRRLHAHILFIAGIALLLVVGCAAPQNFVSINVTPSTVTLNGTQSQVQLTATGIYNKPYAQKDLTAQVTWASDSQKIADFVAVCSDTHDVCQQSLLGITPASCVAPGTCAIIPGLLTAGPSCGSMQVSASMSRPHNSVLIGNAAVTVTQPTCP